jgi:hypothetical protein
MVAETHHIDVLRLERGTRTEPAKANTGRRHANATANCLVVVLAAGRPNSFATQQRQRDGTTLRFGV